MKQTVKRVLTTVLCGALILGAGTALPSVAEHSVYAASVVEKEGNFEYSVSGGAATLTKYTGTDSDVVIPDRFGDVKVTKIGERAFKDNDCLESITIPDSITEIGKNAFYDCNGLKFVDLGHGVTSIGINAFRNDDGLESITIPDSVTEIKDSAFYDCDGLNYVDLGHGVTAIKEHAFYSCDNLKTVKNGEKISAIDQQVFMVLQLNRSIYCQV